LTYGKPLAPLSITLNHFLLQC